MNNPNPPNCLVTRLTHIAHECAAATTQGSKRVQKLNSANGGKPTTWVIHTVNSGSDWNCAMGRTTRDLKDAFELSTGQMDTFLADTVASKLYKDEHSRAVFYHRSLKRQLTVLSKSDQGRLQQIGGTSDAGCQSSPNDSLLNLLLYLRSKQRNTE